MKTSPFRKPPWWVAYSFVLVTSVLFLASWGLQFWFQAAAYIDEARVHGEPADWPPFLARFLAATFENWQSEFLQTIWTVFGLGVFYHWGSSQSREQTDRLEEKVDALLRDRGLDSSLPR